MDVCYVVEQEEGRKPNAKRRAKPAVTPRSGRKRKRPSPIPESDSSEEEIAPTGFEAESEDEFKEKEPLLPSQASTQVEIAIRTRDEEGSCFIPVTPFDSRKPIADSPPRTRKRVEVVISSPRPLKRSRRNASP